MHCFEYNRKPSVELAKYCKKIYYYERSSGFVHTISKKPYIIKTRESSELLKNLKNDTHPILFEGLHTTGFIDKQELTDRLKLVRTHNIEHQYYKMLQRNERNLFKQFFFEEESKKLRNYEKQLSYADLILAISRNDYGYFSAKYGKTQYIPAFHPNNDVNILQGRGKYILYHGNLSVPENIKAADELINNVFGKTDKQVIIAGRNPDSAFENKLKNYANIKLVANPDDTRMSELIRNAQAIIITTNQNSGIKLKLIASLFSGRHCIVNNAMVANTGMEELCIIKNSYEQILYTIEDVWNKPVTAEMSEKRRNILLTEFSNQRNAKKIVELLNFER